MKRREKLLSAAVIFVLLPFSGSQDKGFVCVRVQSFTSTQQTSMKRSFLFFSLLISGYAGHAQWSTSPTVGTPVCIEPGEQTSPQIVRDGSGGAIIAWRDVRGNPLVRKNYAQRMSLSGTALWPVNGIQIADSAGLNLKMTEDGNNGAIVVWSDARAGSGKPDLYAQRISSAGGLQWGNGGVAVCTANKAQDIPELISDGSGGAIITWLDKRNGDDDPAIYAQRLNSSGVAQWTAGGVLICNTASPYNTLGIVSDGAGGAIIAWADKRSAPDRIYLQRINAAGAVQWTSNGVPACTSTEGQGQLRLVSDGSQGVVAVWSDTRHPDKPALYASRINAGGSMQWAPAGVPVYVSATELHTFIVPYITADGSGGVIVTWLDRRNESTANPSNSDVFAQRIDGAGQVKWLLNGIGVCTNLSRQNISSISSDQHGGAVLTWDDERNADADVYAQRLSSAGTVLWGTNGTPISTAPNLQVEARACVYGNATAIIAWNDWRNGNGDIYINSISGSGQLSVAGTSVAAAGLRVSPNPAVSSVVLSGLDASETVRLTDVTGRVLQTLQAKQGALSVDVRQLASGLYFFRTETGAASFIRQ